MSSIASSNHPPSQNHGAPDPRHIKLVQACAAGREKDVRELLSSDVKWTSPLDRDALRTGLQRAAARGNVGLLKLLLENGAEVDAVKESEVPAVIRAAERGHVAATRLLVQWKADEKPSPAVAPGKRESGAPGTAEARTSWANDGLRSRRGSVSEAGTRLSTTFVRPLRRTEAKDRSNRTPLFMASQQGYIEVVKVLLAAGANVNARDKDKRTPLLYLAAEKLFEVKEEVVKLLIDYNSDLEAADASNRTPLIWGTVTGKAKFIEWLFRHGKARGRPPFVNATNPRGRTALHLAAEGNQEEITAILLANGADPKLVSDGRWTALHNAADKGYANIVEKLLAAGANVNAQLDGGMTALHFAAQNGHQEVARLILAHPESVLNLKDSSDLTPLLCAAERGHDDIVDMLRPERNGLKLPMNAIHACERFNATIVDFGINGQPQVQRRIASSIKDVLYGWDKTHDKEKVATQTKNNKLNPNFRWIHLPANNLAWIDDLLTKVFIESGGREIEDFKALEKCLNQEHRGPMVQASFMRTFSQRIPPMTNLREPILTRTSTNTEIIQEEKTLQSPISPTTPAISVSPATPSKSSPNNSQQQSDKEVPPKKKSKAEKFAERHAKKHSTNSPKLANPRNKQQQEKNNNPITPKPGSKQSQHGKLVLFMPFLHYELDSSRQRMSQAIHRTYKRNVPDLVPPPEETADDLLIEAYLRRGMNAPPGLHPRRTLDQFFYHGIDTSERDQDQVVWRYTKRMKMERKIFMVDQLWMWILGKDLIITSFPQRWQQPGRDPLNVLEGIIQDTNVRTQEPITVWDLAMIITARCSGIFDRHRLDDPNYQFVDMFESSIGRVTDRETRLFDRFNKASAKATGWLKDNRRGSSRRFLLGKDFKRHPKFVDTLLSIGIETKLLAEIKDIRDELNIIRKVLLDQLHILPEFVERMTEEINSGKRSTEAYEFKRRSKEQVKIIDTHVKDLQRMDKQAELIYGSLTNLLDLKQKHANAFEARFARAQAAFTARQEQTIMVFTIVTIVFLPMSFIAAVFAINIQEFPKDDNTGQQSMPVSYVVKYLFGIGLSISIPLVFVALWLDDVFSAPGQFARWVSGIIWSTKYEVEEEDELDLDDDGYKAEKPYPAGRTRGLGARLARKNNSRSSVNRDMSPLSDRSNRRSLIGALSVSSLNDRSFRESIAS